jgi:hypothetical protein
MFGSLFNTEKIVSDTIKNSLEEIAIELESDYKDFFVMIKPIDDKFNMKFYVYKIDENKSPKFIREISLKEILGQE